MLCAEDIRQFLDIFPALGYFMFLLGFVMIFIMPPLAPSGLEFLTVSAFASVYISVCFRQRDFSRFLSFFFVALQLIHSHCRCRECASLYSFLIVISLRWFLLLFFTVGFL